MTKTVDIFISKLPCISSKLYMDELIPAALQCSRTLDPMEIWTVRLQNQFIIIYAMIVLGMSHQTAHKVGLLGQYIVHNIKVSKL